MTDISLLIGQPRFGIWRMLSTKWRSFRSDTADKQCYLLENILIVHCLVNKRRLSLNYGYIGDAEVATQSLLVCK